MLYKKNAGGRRGGGGGGGKELCNHSKSNQTTKPVTESGPQQPSVSKEGQRPRQAKTERAMAKMKNKHKSSSLSLSQGQYHDMSESN